MTDWTHPDTKTELRARVLALRDMLGLQAGHGGVPAEEALRTRALEAITVPSDAVVAGYWPMRGEIDVRPLLTAYAGRGHVTALPVVDQPRQALVFRHWAPGDPLEEGRYGTQHPAAVCETVVPTVVFVPLLAFDRRGYRLGYGGGFYDMTLERLRVEADVIAVGVAFAGQEVEEVPTEPHDQRLDWVVTEAEAIRIQGEDI